MNPIIRNSLSIFAGFASGSIVNMGIIMLGPSLIPPPDGVVLTDMESLKASMHLFGPKHFIAPFLGHALGALAGAFIVSKLAASHKFLFAMAMGTLFFLGGIQMTFQLPAPMWFHVLDLLAAYFPMAFLGFKLSEKRSGISA